MSYLPCISGFVIKYVILLIFIKNSFEKLLPGNLSTKLNQT